MTYQKRPFDLEEHDRICVVDIRLGNFLMTQANFGADSMIRCLISHYAVELHGAKAPWEIRNELIADITAHLDEQIEWSKQSVELALTREQE